MRSRSSFAALASLCLVSGCEKPPKQQLAQSVATDSAPMVPSLPVVEPALDREALLLAVAKAASRFWLGAEDREPQRELDGKRFQLRLRFGCSGPIEKGREAPRGWRFDEQRRVLTFKVAPDISKSSLQDDSFAMPQIEAAEGFWIEQPWVLHAACPPALEANVAAPVQPTSSNPPGLKSHASPAPEPTIIVAPQVGIAQFFTNADARTHRRDNRAYEATKTLAEGAMPGTAGYDIVITGRLKKVDDGRVILCRRIAPAVPPRCVISASFDMVSIETANGETVATWSGA